MLRVPFLVGSCVIVAGCVAPAGNRPASGGNPTLTRHFVTGGWVLAGDSCDSDAGVIYRSDGSWIAEGTAGTWRVKKGRLVETVLEQEVAGGELRRLPAPIRYTDEVEVTGPDAFVARRSDGSVRRLRRCAGAEAR